MHGCNSKIRALAALFFVGIFAFYPALLRAEETKEYFFARAALDDLLPLVWTIGDMTGAPFERPLERRTPLASSPVAAENSSAAGHASLPGKDMAAKMRTLAVVALAEFRDTAESFVERLKEEARPYRVPDQLPPPSPPPRTPGAFSFPAREKAVETLEQSISSLKKFFDENVFVNAQMPVREIMRGAPRPPSDDMSAAAAFASALAAAADDTIRSLDALEESLSFAKDVVGERVSDFSKHAMASEEKLRAVFSLLDRFVKTIERERISSAPSFTPAPASLKTFSFAEGFDERLASLATLVDTARSRLEAALPEIEVPVIEAFEAEGNAALSLAPLKDSFTSLKNRFAPAATGTERVSRENRESVTAPSPVLPRIIERIIERPAGEIPVVAGNVSAETLTARLSELENELRAEIFRMAAQNASSQAFTLPILQAVSLAQRINKLSDVTISDATITGSSFAGSVSGTSGSFESATVSGSASTSRATCNARWSIGSSSCITNR
ncbi:MAG: hypothetical protein Q8Q36_03160 [bacterium]|nr:hypothetical protein [bacterium]